MHYRNDYTLLTFDITVCIIASDWDEWEEPHKKHCLNDTLIQIVCLHFISLQF